MQKKQEQPIWDSNFYGMRNYVDWFFGQRYDLRIDSKIFDKADDESIVVLQYDLPSYLFTRKGLHYFLEFHFKKKCTAGDGIKVKLINKGLISSFEPSQILYNNEGVDSFVATHLKTNTVYLSHSTPETPIVEELFKLNEKFDRLLKIIERSANP